MNTGLVLDMILAIILIATVWRSWKAGFVAAFISLVGSLAGYLGAIIFSGPISKFLYTNLAHGWVLEYVGSRLPERVGGIPLEEIARLGGVLGLRKQAVAYIASALEITGLDWEFLFGAHTHNAAEAVYTQVAEGGQTVAQAVTDVLVGPAVEFVLRLAVFFFLFFLINLIIRLLVKMGRQVNQLPLLGTINQVAGLGLGIIQAAVTGYLIVAALLLVVALSGDKWEVLNSQVLAQTTLVLWFKNFSILSLM